MTDSHQAQPDLTKTSEASLLSGGDPVKAAAEAAALAAKPAEFVPDPAKTAEENATAKAAFDTKAADDKKAADEKAAAETKTKEEEAAKAKANDTKATPFKFEEIKLPDGLEIDKTIAEPFVEIVNKHGIPRDAVADLTALQAKAMQSVSEKSTQVWNTMQEDWTKATKADPEIGGEKLAPALGQISKLIDHYKIPELRGVFDLTGAGNNPHVIKFLHNIAKDLGEGFFVPPNNPATGGKDTASLLFPNQGS